jgi:hypothetical protein
MPSLASYGIYNYISFLPSFSLLLISCLVATNCNEYVNFKLHSWYLLQCRRHNNYILPQNILRHRGGKCGSNHCKLILGPLEHNGFYDQFEQHLVKFNHISLQPSILRLRAKRLGCGCCSCNDVFVINLPQP